MRFSSAVLIVKDIERSRQFYINMMDQTVQYDFGKNITFESGLCIWELRESHIIQQKLTTLNAGNPMEMYFEDENLDAVEQKLKQAKVKFLHEIHEEPWGQRTLRFFDPDGHLVEVGEPLAVFVRNMHERGMSVDEIVTKSGIALEDVKEFLGIKHCQ